MVDLRFNKVSKRYRVRHEGESDGPRHPILRKIDKLLRPASDFWALKDVSFEVERGEALGIIGHNGAGKSTILKLLANITSPTSGEITINGRLSALIEVGSGFHPELTGRENIYLNGSILGMSRREITNKLDKIVEFAGVAQFLDTPVKRFSSGMYVRLGFSIAAHLDPDILLLDEVLAVGDASFQAKCLNRIDELKDRGTTIVFISHDLGAVERVCSRVLLLQGGEVVTDAEPVDAIREYQKRSSQSVHSSSNSRMTKEAEIISLEIFGSDEGPGFRTGESICLRIRYQVHRTVNDVVFEAFFFSPDGGNGQLQCHLTTALDEAKVDLRPGTGIIEFSCDELGLQPGLYMVDLTIIHRGQVLGGAIDHRHQAKTVRVDPGKLVRGNFYMPHHWTFAVDSVSEVGEAKPLAAGEFSTRFDYR